MKAVTYDKVKLGGFWKNRFEINKNVTIPAVYERFSETGRFAAFNCDWHEGMEHKPHFFWDSDIAKWIEAVAYTVRQCPDEELETIVDGVVDLIEKHRDPCGYFNIYFTVCEPENRFTNRLLHELYCAGHLIEAAVAYYEATGKDKFLHLMCDYADYIERVFVTEDSAQFTTPGHEEIELALVRLSDCTGDERYLRLAEFFVDKRGTSKKDEDNVHYISLDYSQCHMPVREMSDAVGHSVRAVYLYSAMADLALRAGDSELLEACRRVFNSIAQKRMYITGGIGSTAYGERFTEDYDLPNDLAYSETCASIGLALFARRMSLVDPNSKYADIAETAIYNCALAGVSLKGNSFFYVNPLEINLERHRLGAEYYERKDKLLTQRAEVFDCSCCPPNIARFIASIGDFLYSYDEGTVYVHHYFESEAEFDGIKITQKTEYPNEGDILFTISGMKGKRLAVRVPGWCDYVAINGKQYLGETVKGYIYIDIDSDEMNLKLYLDMDCRLVTANPAVQADLGRVALCRGPIVYCAEKIDNGNVPLDTLLLDSDLEAGLRYNAEMQAYTVKATGFEEAPFDELYRNYSPASTTEREINLIPYFAYANRGESDMQVWLRVK